MAPYPIGSRMRLYTKGYGLLSLARNLSNKLRNQLLGTGLHASKKVPNKAAEATCEFIGNKIAFKIVKPELRQVLQK